MMNGKGGAVPVQIMKAFNETIDYIDRVLDARPEAREIVRLSGYSDALFSRIFSMLTGCTLSEYIRFRRLTQAAADLRETDEKVIDLALKYGYESPDAFSAAFKTFHAPTLLPTPGARKSSTRERAGRAGTRSPTPSTR